MLVFFHWAILMFATIIGPDDMRNFYKPVSNFFRFVFNNDKFGNLMFYSPLLMPIIFIIISIIRRRVSIWECLAIITTWAMVLYVFPHLRT